MRAPHRRRGVAGRAADRGRATGLQCCPGPPAAGQRDPVAIRLGTSDAQQAHDTVRAAGVTLHNEELVRMEGVPAMFSFTDPDGNGLVYLQDTDQSEPR